MSPYYFNYLLLNLRFIIEQQDILETIKLFISNWDGRWDWLQTSAEHDVIILKHLSWRSRWIILCTIDRKMAVSCEISRAAQCLFGWSSYLSTRSSTAMWRTRSTTLPGCQTILPVLQILFSRPSMLPSFQPLSCNLLNCLHAPYCFYR